jgi:pimeloyl-ACP methyl ester carboxylesterase
LQARLISVELRGHGGSDKPGGAYRLSTLAADVRGLMDVLGIASAMVVGHSLGSLVAQHLAADTPERVDRLVLIGLMVEPPVTRGDSLGAEIAGWTAPPSRDHPFLAAFQSNSGAVDAGFVATAIEKSTRLPLHVWQAVLEEITDKGTVDVARRVQAPTLILWGNEDSFFGPEHQAALRAAIPTARFVTFPGVGHNPHWERPQRVARLIAEFANNPGMLGVTSDLHAEQTCQQPPSQHMTGLSSAKQ